MILHGCIVVFMWVRKHLGSDIYQTGHAGNVKALFHEGSHYNLHVAHTQQSPLIYSCHTYMRIWL